MSQESPGRRPDVIVIPHRPRRWPKGIVLSLMAMTCGVVVLGIRAAQPDWRGLIQETRGRAGSWFVASNPAVKAEALKPVPPAAKALAKAKIPARPEAAAPRKEKDAWDEIRREAEKAKADRDEAERIKNRAESELAEATPPPPRWRGRMNPAVAAEIRRRQAAMMMQMEAQMAEQQARMRNEILRFQNDQMRMFEDFARRPPGLGPGAFPGFDRPLPGMDRMMEPLPGRPIVQERSGQDVRDGVRWSWRTRIVILRSSDL